MTEETYPCPKNGCESTDAIWCSECGAPMAAQVAVPAAPGADPAHSAVPSDTCPDCGTPRDDPHLPFCQVCRYNFTTRDSYQPQPSSPSVPPAPPPVAAPPVSPPPAESILASAPPNDRWDAIIDVEAGRDPEPPPPIPRRIFPLELPENLIGRRSDRLNIHPEIPIDQDEAVSKRHARIFFDLTGSPMLLDLNSSNGTLLNGITVAAGVPTAVADGDVVAIGRWTKITLKAR